MTLCRRLIGWQTDSDKKSQFAQAAKQRFAFQTVLFSVALLTFTAGALSDTDAERPYESAEGICSKCNCTSVNGTSEDRESENLFTLDCSMKSFAQLFAKWPEEMGDNHSGI